MGENEIDKLLEQLRQEYSEAKSPDPSSSVNHPQTTPKPPIKTPTKTQNLRSQDPSGIDKLLLEVKADLEQKDIEAELERQQRAEVVAKIQAQIRAQQQQALEKKAEEWLKQLEPFSTEGLWFESFAKNYPSQLAAAIEYLQEQEQGQ